MKAVVLFSGGLDSTTLAWDLRARGYELHLLSFDYGQRHHKELAVAAELSSRLFGVATGQPHHIIELNAISTYGKGPLADVLGESALVNAATAVPEGHYADESMRATVVPNRNAIMLSIAYGVAVAERADIVAFAAHAGDHAIYPDCRPEFVNALDKALRIGNAWGRGDSTPQILAPYVTMSKGDIAVLAHQLVVPVSQTWSCYKGGNVHCGRCGTCVERMEALDYAQKRTGRQDPTQYADTPDGSPE